MLRFWGSVVTAGSAVIIGSFLLLSSEPAHGFCRTTTVGIPANYNPVDRGCFEEGLFLFWRNQCVSYSVSEQASRVADFDTASKIIDHAFARWPAVTCGQGQVGIQVSNIGPTTCTEVRYNPDSANQNMIVFRDDGWPYNDAFSTLGLTTVTFNADTGEIFDADMEINSSQRNLVAGDDIPKNGFDLESVVTHEAGHFLGLAHSQDKTATMYASYAPGTTVLRTLSTDDVKGICSIYPSADTRNVSEKASPTGAIKSEACNAAPRHGYTKVCEDPKEEKGCALAPTPKRAPPFGSFAVAGVLGLGLFAIRRRRRR
jgi:MYXO-CTERM domain-containing protein